MNSNTLKKIFGSLIAVLAGAVFIFSGATKLMPVEAFEISLVDIGFTTWQAAPIFARLLIGLEFTIGFLLIFHYRLRKFTAPLAALLLVIFTIYIVYLLKAYGNRGSCGCFGTVVEFTPLEGFIKNIVLMLMLFIAYQWAFAFEFKFKWLAAAVVAVILFILPFVINPVGYAFGTEPMSEFKSFSIDTSLLYKGIDSITPQQDITKGKHLVAFMSATCPHCRLAAKKIVVFKKQSPGLPVLFVLYNSKDKLRAFFDDTKSDSIPRILMNSKEGFLQLTQGSFPRIFWFDKGKVIYETNYYVLDKKEVSKWISSKN